MRQQSYKSFLAIVAGACVLLFVQSWSTLFGQIPPPTNVQLPNTPEPVQLLSPDQLDDLVAPIALYPDPLISQILVAATYPLELVEASQWLQRNPALAGPALTQSAEAQMWDPSVQALVMFPDVIKRLNEDIAWTTNLGNAFLSQEADVMDAIQRMRVNAEQSGKLNSTPQQQVITAAESGQPVVEIIPTNPEVLYVPVYDPVWILGPPVYYPYPRWYFAPHAPVLFFGPGIPVVTFLGGGWGGWAGWGWHPVWVNHSIIVNNTFIHRYNFNSTHVASLSGTTIWSHDAFHRHGVPYPTPTLTQRFHGDVRQNLGPRPPSALPRTFSPSRPAAPLARPGERMGNRMIPPNIPNRNRSAFGGIEDGATSRLHIDRGHSSLGPARSAPRPLAPAPHLSSPAPRSRQNAGRARGR
jgi:Protein of unknown function (DUF3300)